MLTTNYVLFETVALLQNRLGLLALRSLSSDVEPVLTVSWIDRELHDRGMASLQSQSRHRLSLANCLSFETMRKLGIRCYFALDRHFAEQDSKRSKLEESDRPFRSSYPRHILPALADPLPVIGSSTVVQRQRFRKAGGLMGLYPPVTRSSFRQILGSILSCCVLLLSVGITQAEVSRENLSFLEYAGFPEAHSTWGSIGYSAKHNKIFIGVTNHRDKVGLFEYDVESRQMRLRGFLPELAHLRDFQWQGKIHSRIWEAPDGAVYFSTDGGESREEYLMNHPHGYGGGFLMKWDPGNEQLINLGYGLQFESLKDIAVDRISGMIVGVSYPQGHLLRFSPEGRLVEDMGRVASDHIPRVLWSDWWGNIYYVDWRQRIVKWERSSGKLLFSEVSLPAFEGTPGEKIITGVTAFAEDREAGVIYLVTYGSMIIAFHPTETGIGEARELGGLFDRPGRKPYSYYCPNLGLGRNGKLYYFIGGHGNWAVDGEESVVLMEFDPQVREKKIQLSFPITEISEVTGHGVRDRDGNLYFCGRRHNPRAEQMGESGASRPFMIILNPEEALQ